MTNSTTEKSKAGTHLTKDGQSLAVIFRVFKKQGDVIALFPSLPGTNDPGTCMSYQHVGQHGAAAMGLHSITRPATEEEAEPLLRELATLGYRLRVISRASPHHWRARRKALMPVSE